MGRSDSLEKTLCWERLKAEGEGTTEDEMVGWHHRPNRHESEQALGDGEGQGSLACCSPRGDEELDMTEPLSNLSSEHLLSVQFSGTKSIYNVV